MSSSLGRFGVTLAFLRFASLLPTTVGAQPPLYLTQWSTPLPFGVAVDGGGNVYVADAGDNRIQKFGYTSTPTMATTWGRFKRLYH